MSRKVYTLADIIELEQKARKHMVVRYWNELEKATRQYIERHRAEAAAKEARGSHVPD